MKTKGPIRSVSFLLDANRLVRESVWRAHVVGHVNMRDDCMFLQDLLEGKHPRVTSESSPLLSQCGQEIVGARQATGNEGAVTQTAGHWYGALSDPTSEAKGAASLLNESRYQAALLDPFGTLHVKELQGKSQDKWKRIQAVGFERCSPQDRKWVEEIVAKVCGAALGSQLAHAGIIGPSQPPAKPNFAGGVLEKHSRFAKSVFARSAAHLASHVTRSRQRDTENQERREQAEASLTRIHGEHRDTLLAIEAALTLYFEKQSGHTSKQPFMLSPSAMKGYRSVRRAWLKSQVKTVADYQEIIRKVQTQHQKEMKDFGSVPVFDHLALHPELWEVETVTEDEDGFAEDATTPLDLWVNYRAIQPYRQHRFTLPDPIDHPTWVEFDDGRNQVEVSKYPTFTVKGKRGVCTLELPDSSGNWQDIETLVHFNKRIARDVQDTWFLVGSRMPNGQRTRVAVKPGGAKLVLNRDELQHPKDFSKVQQARVLLAARTPYPTGPTERDPQLLRRVNEAVRLLEEAYGDSLRVELHVSIELQKEARQRVKGLNEKKLNLRDFIGLTLMSLDLGVRNAGGVAILVIMDTNDLTTLPCVELGNGVKVAIKHSATLYLPGDNEHSEPLEEMLHLIRVARKMLRLQSDLVRMYHGGEAGEFEDALAWVKGTMERVLKTTQHLPHGLVLPQDWDDFLMASNVEDQLRYLEEVNRTMLRLVRQRGTNNPRGMGGLSARREEMLQRFLRYEKAYASRAFLGEDKIVAPQKRGISDLPPVRRLHSAIVNFREERVRKIVSAYVGYTRLYNVDVVIHENLTEFRPNSAQSKQTNRTLTKWRPKEILKLLEQGLDGSGVEVRSINPAYTSQFDCFGRPGVRAERMTEWMRASVARFQPTFAEVAVGDLVPRRGGSRWVSLRDGKLIEREAETVAAESIGVKWMVERSHSDRVVRVTASSCKGEHVVVYPPAFVGATVHRGSFDLEPQKRKVPESGSEVYLRDYTSSVVPSEWLPKDEFQARVRYRLESEIQRRLSRSAAE